MIGFLFIGIDQSHPLLFHVNNLKLPSLVLVDRSIHSNVGSIGVDNINPMVQLLQYVEQMGHKKIAFYGTIACSQPSTANYDRLTAFRNCTSNQFEKIELSSKNDDSLEDALTKAMFEKERVSAIFCLNSGYLFHCYRTLYRHELRVPEDISLVACHDQIENNVIDVDFSCFTQPLEKVGALAVDKIVALYNNEEEIVNIILPAKVKDGRTVKRI